MVGLQQEPAALRVRWLYLALGMAAMLFAGVQYAWSVWRVPLMAQFHWSLEDMSLNYTLAMSFFGLGGLGGGRLLGRLGLRRTLLLAAALVGVGFAGASALQGSLLQLYLCYAVLSGMGVGVVYNVVVSAVSAWFPDRRGLPSGCLLMSYGTSTLLFGSLFDVMFASPLFGWRRTYLLFGIASAVVLVLAAAVLRLPGADTPLPPAQVKKSKGEVFEQRDWTTGEMLRRSSFWRMFLCITLLSSVGITTFSFAYDLALSVGAAASTATALVGLLAICNGTGRVIFGLIFDAIGRRTTMRLANGLILLAAGTTLTAVALDSLLLCVLGFLLVGFAHGATPILCSGVVAAFYGQKHFATNYSVINFCIMPISILSNLCNLLLVHAGTFLAPYTALACMAFAALGLNLSIRRP